MSWVYRGKIMAKNVLDEVVKLLGVEVDEEFKIEGLSFRYQIDEDGLIFWAEGCQKWLGSDLIGDLLTGKEKIVKLPKQTLTDAEKRYLSNVIEPFRDRVIVIVKGTIPGYNGKEFISFLVQSPELCKEYFSLPMFDMGTMYKGMKPDKKYTLEELG